MTMKFVIEEQPWEPISELIYRPEAYAFDAIPRPDSVVSSVLVNDTELEVDERGTVLCVTGLCPHPAWQRTGYEPPQARRLSLRVDANAEWVPGISRRLTGPSALPIFVNPRIGFVCIGDPQQRAEAVEFAPGCIALLNEGNLVALWLRPKELPSGF
jgi:hypothetical protein